METPTDFKCDMHPYGAGLSQKLPTHKTGRNMLWVHETLATTCCALIRGAGTFGTAPGSIARISFAHSTGIIVSAELEASA